MSEFWKNAMDKLKETMPETVDAAKQTFAPDNRIFKRVVDGKPVYTVTNPMERDVAGIAVGSHATDITDTPEGQAVKDGKVPFSWMGKGAPPFKQPDAPPEAPPVSTQLPGIDEVPPSPNV